MRAAIWLLTLFLCASVTENLTLTRYNANLRAALAVKTATGRPQIAASGHQCAAWWFGKGSVSEARKQICGR